MTIVPFIYNKMHQCQVSKTPMSWNKAQSATKKRIILISMWVQTDLGGKNIGCCISGCTWRSELGSSAHTEARRSEDRLLADVGLRYTGPRSEKWDTAPSPGFVRQSCKLLAFWCLPTNNRLEPRPMKTKLDELFRIMRSKNIFLSFEKWLYFMTSSL